MRYIVNNLRRLYGLLKFLIIVVVACTYKVTFAKEFNEKNHSFFASKSDSIEFEVYLKRGDFTGFNLYNNFLENFLLKFENKDSVDLVVSQKIPRLHNQQVIMYGYFDRKTKELSYQYFFIGESDETLTFEYFNGFFELVNNSENIFEVSNLYNEYREILYSIRKYERDNTLKNRKQELLNILESKHVNFKEQFHKSNNISQNQREILLALNNYQFYDKLQILNTLDTRPDNFLMQLSNPINGEIIGSLFYQHVKNRINEFDFSKLDSLNYNPTYLHYLTLGIYSFLKDEINKGDSKFNRAKKWLETTNWYKSQSSEIKNKINPIDGETFKELLSALRIRSTSMNELTIVQVLNQYPSDYYLVDFWATWCKPCIEGIKIMAEKDIPEHVSVISLSLDKSNKIEKWKEMTLKLNQRITYLVSEDDSLKKFVDFMELQSIPRYVIIDREMNIIDESFLAPHESDFIKELEALK